MTTNILTIGTFFPSVISDLSKEFEIVECPERSDIEKLSANQCEHIEGLATFGWAPKDLIEKFPRLKLISSFGVGYDGVDADFAASKEIIVTHTPNVLNDDVANTAIMLILATMRRLIVQDKYLRDGRWVKEGNAPLTTSIRGKKVGIVGLGRIGEAIAEKLSVFQCETVYHSRNKKEGVPYTYYGNLVEMAKECDLLIAITPGGPATNKLINRDVIEALGPQGTLINVARGTVVDETEMVNALQDRRLGAAGLDVFEDEPNVPEELFSMENVVLTPHVASATWETRQAMSDLVVANLVSYFSKGKVETPVPECANLTGA